MERFPFDEIYGLHNAPGLAVGAFETRAGPFMAAEDLFEIVLDGSGGHAAAPQEMREVLVGGLRAGAGAPDDRGAADRTRRCGRRFGDGACQRRDPERCCLARRGSAATRARSGRRSVPRSSARCAGSRKGSRSPTVSGQARTYVRDFVPLANDAACADHMLAAARDLLGPAGVRVTERPFMGSEDFARFLEHVPGCFGFVGNGETSAPLHNPTYDFDDAALLPGARLHAAIARRRLPRA